MKTALLQIMLLLTLVIFKDSLSQSYSGPATGSVSSGGVVSTETFFKSPEIKTVRERGTRNVLHPEKKPMYINFDPSVIVPESKYVEDPNVGKKNTLDTSMTVLLKSFQGLGMGNSIPPDPHASVGPEHVIATVNAPTVGIWDKQGNLIKTINPDTWFDNLVSSPDAFDPQIMYDHFDKKWIMTWDSQNDGLQRGLFLVAVSDDSIPLGTWYIWALPSNQNGATVVDNWGDFPQIGFDRNAIYINTQQFGFPSNPGLKYSKVRIINKSEIYNSLGGALSWVDIWDIRYPQFPSERPNILIPCISYSDDDTHYFLHSPRSGVATNFITLYKIINPTSNPQLSGVNLPVQNYYEAPDADQLGGGTPRISSNGSGMKSAPIYRDGYLWGVHSIANPNSLGNSAIRYYKIDVNASSVVESATLGATNFWYIFPNLTVDKYQNIAITYSRSGLTEYCGAFYTTRLKNDPPGLSGSKVLKEGTNNYVVTFGGTRNRWGDYMGIYLDPVDETNVWMFTEYVAASNVWGTWVGNIRMVPFPGAHVFTYNDSLDFGEFDFDVAQMSDTLTAEIKNYGSDTLIITNIPSSFGGFQFVSNLSFPVKIPSYGSLELDFVFSPQTSGPFNIIYPITNNDPNFNGIRVKGYAYRISPADDNIVYASSGASNNGGTISINPFTGSGTFLGSSLFSEVTDIAIHPASNIIYGIAPLGSASQLLRVNSDDGDAHKLLELTLGSPKAIAFDTSGTLYALSKNGRIYTVDLVSGSANLVLDTNFTVAGIAFHPLTNQLWATSAALITNRDRVFIIDLAASDTTVVGKTSLNTITNNIAFDGAGVLYGITGSATQTNNLIKINTATAAGTLIGATGFVHLTGLDLTSGSITSVDGEGSNPKIPIDFVLMQNYPNPFNPSTNIEFALPVAANVKLKIYNLLGQTIKVIYDGVNSAGYHKFTWNSDDSGGNSVSSGIYFYELSAMGTNGTEFKQMKKMILIK